MIFKELTKVVLFLLGEDKEKDDGWSLDKSDNEDKKKCC